MAILRSKITIVVASGFTIMFGALGARAFMQERALRRDIAKLESGIAKAEEKNKELVHLVEYFSKPEQLEKEAKVRLNLKRPDEEVLALSSEPPYIPSASGNPSMSVQTTTFPFSQIVDFFKSFFTYSLKE
ncbi:MAG: septum formation initiator family protein [bacterium]|nr:septum formation initiator family protein [bacterium]